jgi:hypothetical protein
MQPTKHDRLHIQFLSSQFLSIQFLLISVPQASAERLEKRSKSDPKTKGASKKRSASERQGPPVGRSWRIKRGG